MDFTKHLDLYLDPKLIFERFPMWALYLAILGFLTGLITAFVLWYRSARRIKALEEERRKLKEGDIEIDDLPLPEPARAGGTVAPALGQVSEVSRTKVPEIKPEKTVATTVTGRDHATVPSNSGGFKKPEAGQTINRNPGFNTTTTGFDSNIKKPETGQTIDRNPGFNTTPTSFDSKTGERKPETPKSPQKDIPRVEVPSRQEDDFRLATVYKEKPADADDLTLLEGIDEGKAGEMNRAGIYKLSQLQGLDEEARRKFGFKFGWPNINWGSWGATATGSASLLNKGSREVIPAEVDYGFKPTATFAKIPDPIGALGTVGAGLGSLLKDCEAKNKEINLQLPTVYTQAPDDADDLTQLEGIDVEKAEELHRAGIYKISQLEELDPVQREKFKFPDIGWGKLGGALGTVGAGLGSLHKDGEAKAKAINFHLPTVYDQAPDDADDLTLLEGIDNEKAAELRRAGIYKFSQLNDLNEAQREKFSEKFKFSNLNWGALGTLGGGILVASPLKDSLGEYPSLSNDTQKIQLSGMGGDKVETKSDWTWGYTFKERPDHADDLSQLDGISVEDAARLNAEGVYTIKQLENLPVDKREEVKSKFGWGDIDWGKWGTVGAPVVASTVAELPDLTVKPSSVVTFPKSEVEDESLVWETESAKLSGKLPSLDASAKYGELALSREDFAGKLSEDFDNESVEVHPRYGIIYKNKPDQIDDLTVVKGIGVADEAQLNKNGVYRIKQIATWNAGVIEGISSDLKLGSQVRDEEWVSQAKEMASGEPQALEYLDKTDYSTLISSKYTGKKVVSKPGLGILYTDRPLDADDLTEIKGIGATIAEKLNQYGVYKFEQLADWNDKNITAFNERLDFSGRIERDDWVTQAKSLVLAQAQPGGIFLGTIPAPSLDSYAGVLSRFSGEAVQADAKLGVVYHAPPPKTDDLKAIVGIGNRIEKDLNDNGVYRFSQIAAWNEYNCSEFDKKLDLRGRIARDKWISQASHLAKESHGLQSRYKSILLSQFAGESVTVKPGYGVVYTREPSLADDLTEINGIGAVTEKRLNDAGIYTFKQIANWDDGAVKTIEEDIDGPGRVTRDNWIRQAQEFAKISDIKEVKELEPEKPDNMAYLETLDSFDGENVDIDDSFGVVYTGRPTEQDDLKRIRGVGKYLEGKLNSSGVYRFKQIAKWNDYNIWAFGKELAFPGRIARENWVSQARELAELEDCRIEAEKLAKTHFAGSSVKVDPELGVVYRKKPSVVDDLTKLEGIDKKIVDRLHSDGIFTFEQIKNLKGAQRKSFASRFGIDQIDWAKWSGVSALGALGTEAIKFAKAEVSQVIDNLAIKPAISHGVISDHPDNLDFLTDEPKGIFGKVDDYDCDSNASGSGKKPRVVFIMDVSRSLTPAQLRLSKSELSAAVTSLPFGSLYQVIFFSGPTWFAHQRMIKGGARGEDVLIADGEKNLHWISGFGGFEYEGGNDHLPGAAWREANPENVAATMEDIEAVGKSYGTTWHLPLTMALNLNPVPRNIYFLTDGETARQDQVAEEMIELAQERGGKTKINTIALMVPGASFPLHRIATGTGGEYSLVIAGGKVLKDDDLKEYLGEKGISLDD